MDEIKLIKTIIYGPPSPIRTGDLPLRRGTLYPAELRAVIGKLRIIPSPAHNGKPLFD